MIYGGISFESVTLQRYEAWANLMKYYLCQTDILAVNVI